MKLVIDANVVISALIADSKTRELIVTLEPDLLTPAFVYEEVENYEDLIVEKSGMEPDRVAQFIDLLFQYIEVVPADDRDPDRPLCPGSTCPPRELLPESSARAPDSARYEALRWKAGVDYSSNNAILCFLEKTPIELPHRGTKMAIECRLSDVHGVSNFGGSPVPRFFEVAAEECCLEHFALPVREVQRLHELECGLV